MKQPLLKVPSLGTLHTHGYWLALPVMMLGGVLPVLYFILVVTIAVSVRGAFDRTPKRPWRCYAIASLLCAASFLVFQFIRHGSAGLIFSNVVDPFAFATPVINAVSLLGALVIFLPLSAACAIDRLRKSRATRQGR